MGRIFAVLIGENIYSAITPEQSRLEMCVRDATVTAPRILARHGADPKNAHTLLDAANTRANMLAEGEWLADRREPGDILYLHVSSHGTHGMRHGRLEQALCCFGCVDPGRFNQDLVFQADLQAIFSRVPEGVKVFVVIDACMNGLRGIFRAGASNRFMPPPPDAVAEFPANIHHLSDGVDGVEHGAASLHRGFLSWLTTKKRPTGEFEVPDLPGADPVWMSGCTKNGTCADAPDIGGGAFTVSLDHADAACVKGSGLPVPVRSLFHGYSVWLTNAGFDQKPEIWSTTAGLNGMFL